MVAGTGESLFASPNVIAVRRSQLDGHVILRSAEPLRPHPLTVVHSLRNWARANADYPLVAERSADGDWRMCSYGTALEAANAIGQALLDRGLGPGRPLLVLSGNSVDHLLMTLGAMTAGIAVVPVSVAYSLQSRDHARIRAICEVIRPAAAFAENGEVFAEALEAIPDVRPIVSAGAGPKGDLLAELLATVPSRAVEQAFGSITGDVIAKILFTSGSTGAPKGVLTTHRMLSSNQQMIGQVWPFLATERPVIVDWLPWSHTFGGNHNMDMMLTFGGTLYVDGGRPAPGLFAQTITNLTEVPPTIYFNVPAGYAQLVPALEGDPAFAARFFSRLRLLFNAAAALPPALRERLATVATRSTEREIPVTAAWGTTETAPAATTAHFDFADARCIGVPLPGAEIKLVPAEGGAYEIRVRGPMVTPGYFGRPDLTAEAFDEDGFYCSGDAVALADEADVNAGLVFRGRIAEDFKLETGTFVRVGAVRTALLSAVPLLSDAVLAGENAEYIGALAWLNLAEVSASIGATPASDGEVIADKRLHDLLAEALARYNADRSSSTRVERLVVMSRPADLDAGEITDKGYVNQRKVLASRAGLVTTLFAEPPPAGVVLARASA